MSLPRQSQLCTERQLAWGGLDGLTLFDEVLIRNDVLNNKSILTPTYLLRFVICEGILLEIETSTAVTHGDGISIVELETTTADVIEITTGVFSSSGSGGSSNASEIVGLTSFINNVIDRILVNIKGLATCL